MANENNNIQATTDDSQIVLYQPDESISLHVKIDGAFKTVWLSLDQMAELFGRDRSALSGGSVIGDIIAFERFGRNGELDVIGTSLGRLYGDEYLRIHFYKILE